MPTTNASPPARWRGLIRASSSIVPCGCWRRRCANSRLDESGELPGRLGGSYCRSFEESVVATSWSMSGCFAWGSGLTFGFESGVACGPEWSCSPRGVKPIVAGTLPCGTNHVPARFDPLGRRADPRSLSTTLWVMLWLIRAWVSESQCAYSCRVETSI